MTRAVIYANITKVIEAEVATSPHRFYQHSCKDCYANKAMAESNITYSSAYIHNLCRDYDQLQADEQAEAKFSMIKFLANYVATLGPDVFTKPDQFKDFMIEKSNIPTIHKMIEDKIIYQYRERLLDDIDVKYRDIVHELNRYSRAMCLMNDDLLQVSQENAKDLSKMVAREQRDYQEFNQFKIKVQKFIGENT